ILLDAFGWSAFERHSGHPFLRRFAQDGVVAQITSQFPSTTAAHVTCLHTGLPVGAGGIYEWFQYEPALDAIVAPLLFSFAGDATAVLDALEEALADLAGCHALLLLTADHGMTAIDPGTTMYVNLLWPGIAEHLRRGRGARPLAPAGSARDLFLHVRPGRLEE